MYPVFNQEFSQYWDKRQKKYFMFLLTKNEEQHSKYFLSKNKNSQNCRVLVVQTSKTISTTLLRQIQKMKKREKSAKKSAL